MHKRASSEIDHALRRIAEKQLGLVSAAQACTLELAGMPWRIGGQPECWSPCFPES